MNGLEVPGTTRGTAADAGLAGHERPAESYAGRGPRPADDRRRRPLPRHRDADVRRVVPGRGGGRARRRGGRLMAGRSGGRRAGPAAARRDPRRAPVAGRVRRRLRHRGGGHGRRPPDRALGPRGRPRRLGPGRGPRGRAPAPRARDADRPRSCARSRATTRTRWRGSCRRWAPTSARSCPAWSSASPSSTARGWVQANTAAFAGLIGRLEGELLEQMLPPGSGFTQGGRDARQPLDHDPPARAAARVHGPARARAVRPRAADRRDDARPAPVRRGEHPPDRGEPRRARRAVPDLDRAPRDDPRVRVRGAPVAPAVPRGAAGAPADAVQPGGLVDGPGRGAGARVGAPRRRAPGRPALAGAPDDRPSSASCSARRRRS